MLLVLSYYDQKLEKTGDAMDNKSCNLLPKVAERPWLAMSTQLFEIFSCPWMWPEYACLHSCAFETPSSTRTKIPMAPISATEVEPSESSEVAKEEGRM